MRRWKSKGALAALLLAGAAFAQNAAQKPSVDVSRVGHRIACQCGCVDTVATCAMLECSFSNPAKQRIAKLQMQGKSDQSIIDGFIAEYGQQIYRGAPNAWGWLVPYLSLIPGLALVLWFLKRYQRHRPAGAAPEISDADLGKYRAQIEKDLANLE